jgi:transcriptional regulator with XRE-family HTH domain
MATVDPSDDPRSHLRRQDSDGVATLLREARKRRGLTLEQVAHETKVPLERLAALEQYGLSGGSCGFYQRARIRAFARAVHIDDRVLLDVLQREAPPEAPAPVRPQRARRRSSRGQHLVTLVACGVIVVGIARIVWQEPRRGTENHAVAVAPLAQPERHTAPTTGTIAVAQPAPLIAQVTPVAPNEPRGNPASDVGPQPIGTTVPTELVIITEPGAARVAVNGIGWGSTPVTIQHLSPGEKRIRVTKDGYAALERITRVVADRSTTVDIQLQPLR